MHVLKVTVREASPRARLPRVHNTTLQKYDLVSFLTRFFFQFSVSFIDLEGRNKKNSNKCIEGKKKRKLWRLEGTEG